VVTEIEFCLLGSLLVRQEQVEVTVPRGKQRAILAMLLLNAGQVVRVDELAETLWASGPPPSGPVAVQNYVMRLRKTLGDYGGRRIITKPRGYLLRVEAGELDVSRFEVLVGAARAAARDGLWDQAATDARAALMLWRGEPLSDVDSEVLTAREVPRLEELRLSALELRIDADLHLGRHAGVIAELQYLAGTYPLREHLRGLLMTALYRDGRQAEALAAYQQVRQVLVEELGTEPGAGLRKLHRQILAADPVLELSAAERSASGYPGPAVPRQLPATVRHFTGRAQELAELSRLLDQAGQDKPEAVVISAIGGTAGVGKPKPGANTRNRYRAVT
jgi:DNA-binding SARP family transcriptional activator